MKMIMMIAICLLMSMRSVAAAENSGYKFRLLSPDGGFYYDGVKQIEQDDEGFIWVMMENELYRFDGYHYKKYRPYFSELYPGKRWLFLNMAADASGHLYINTNNGIFRYDVVTAHTERVYDRVDMIKVDGRDRLWIRTQKRWNYWDEVTGKPVTPLYDGKEQVCTSISLCSYGQNLFGFVGREIYRFNYVDRQFEFCTALSNRLFGGGGEIRFAQIRKGFLWTFVDKEGLYQIELATWRVKKQIPSDFILGDSSLRSYFVDAREDVWFGTQNGVYILHAADGNVSHYTHLSDNPFSLPDNSVWSIYEDRQQNIWIGMYSGKLCSVNLNEGDAFTSWTPQNSGLNFAPVSALAEDGNSLWIGTEGGSVNRMDRLTGEIVPFARRGGERAFSNVKSLVIDARKRLWIATFREGLGMYDMKRRHMVCYRHRQGNEHSLLMDDVRKITLEADSGLWIVYQCKRPVLTYLSFDTPYFNHYELDSVQNYLFDICRYGKDKLYALSNEALYCMNIHTHEVEKMTPADSAYWDMNTFCTDDSGNFWIGTTGNGLVKYDTHAKQFQPVAGVQPDKVYSIYAICYDDGKIWMGTDDGLYCYDITDGHLARFDKVENTQGQVYYPLSVMKGEGGRIYFGGTEGLTEVVPVHITYNRNKPKAVISDFFIDQQPVRVDYVSDDSYRKVVLGYDRNNFGFSFASDNYHIPEKNLFRYRLRGYNNDWVTVDARNRTVMYSKVPPGIYYFEVCAANNDGVWSDAPTVVKVVCQSAPWFSLWAYLLYLLIVAGGVYLVYRHFSEKKKLKMMLYQESMERDKEEQIHQAQLRFFTNISHDFRTPLSLIMAALDKLRREGLKEYYYRILHSNVQRLLNLVNELMDFRTIENGMMKLELEPIDISRMVTDIGNDFTDYAKQRNIDFRIITGEDFPTMVYADKHVVEKIVMNLLNNAFKYTRDKGTIRLEIRSDGQSFVSRHTASFTVGDCGSHTFCLVVSDTGVGISRESITKVFERFYKVNTVHADSHLGTGIGLALVKSLVLLHKGSVTIYSERDKGTDMVVRLPLDTGIYDTSDFKQRKAEDMEVEAVAEEVEAGTTCGSTPKNSQYEDRKRILLAEDNADLRVLITEALSSDFLVTQVADGVEALTEMERDDFDLVISDIMMPNKDGISLCYEIKHNLATSHIPVVLLTAKTSMESKIEGVDSGADLYFEKPVDLTYLRLSLLNIFRNREQLKEHYAKNYYADSSELVSNEQDSKFMKQLVDFIESNIEHSQLDVNRIAEELCMSRSKLYSKVKGLTGKSIVEFVLNYRLRKAARLIIEENLTIREVMTEVGIESPSYFSNSFKKMFGETPTAFAARHK